MGELHKDAMHEDLIDILKARYLKQERMISLFRKSIIMDTGVILQLNMVMKIALSACLTYDVARL